MNTDFNKDIFIYQDDSLICPITLKLSDKLDIAREEIRKEIKDDNFIFLKGTQPIQKENERKFKINHIIIESKDEIRINIKNNKKVNQIEQDEFSAPLRRKTIFAVDVINKLNNKTAEEENNQKPIKGSLELKDYKKEENENDEDEDSKNKRNLTFYQYPNIQFTDKELNQVKNILVIGETGSGKTTSINSFVNALMQVTLGYPFRYVLIPEQTGLSQAHSQTQEVTLYKIRAKDGRCYQIIDTPGYGDVKGVNQDIIITQKISAFIKDNLKYINAIFFVVRSSSARLTPTQKYIFHSILDLFGEDVMSNFIALLTFSDGESPQVAAALKEPGSGYDIIIPKVEKPWYYQLNNSAISSRKNNTFTTNFWNLGMNSLNKLIARIEKLSIKPLDQTKEVINKRKKLESLIECLQLKLQKALDNVSLCKQEYKIINDLEKDIKDSENYTREIENVKMRTVQVPEGSHTTTCLYCNTTCHKICYIKGDNEKYNCSAMYNGFCQVCNNKCKWDQHKNTPYYYESYIVKEIITLKELQKKYNDSSSKANEKKNLLNNIKTQIKNLNKECIETQEEITNTINILRKIALNKEILSAEEHIDILISNEKMEKNLDLLIELNH